MKHQNLINKMTLDEKVAFLSGKLEWESRGMSGLRFLLSSALTDRMESIDRLAQEIGEALGEESEAWEVNVLLGLNIKRSPLCGRNF